MLNAFLDRSSRFEAEYGNGLTSHLSMALISFAKLGADSSILDRFYSSYSERLDQRTEPQTYISACDWQQHIGYGNRYGQLSDFFTKEIAQHGRTSVLRKYIPLLARGVASCGLHGLIRTAYGIEAEHDGEVAEGLALWANRHYVLSASVSHSSKSDPFVILAAVRQHQGHRSEKLAGQPIADAMRNIDAIPWFGDLVAGIEIRPGLLAQLATIAAAIFVVSPDFAALHLITATHALRIVSPYAEGDALLRGFWVSFAAIYVQIGAPYFRVDALPTRTISDWPDIIAVAFERLDDHLVKLVYSCLEEEKAYGFDTYRYIAARQTGLL